MTARQPARGRAPAVAKTAAKAAEQGQQRPDSGADPAPKPAKLVRKGRKPSAGAQLRRRFARKTDPFEVELLIDQAARAAERREVIGRMLSGDANAWLAVKVGGQVAEVVVTDLVREERQQSELLRKLIMDIQRLRGDESGGKGSGDGGKQDDPVARIVEQHYGGRKRA